MHHRLPLTLETSMAGCGGETSPTVPVIWRQDGSQEHHQARMPEMREQANFVDEVVARHLARDGAVALALRAQHLSDNIQSAPLRMVYYPPGPLQSK